MNLFETLKNATLQGYHITLAPSLNQFMVIVKKEVEKGGWISRESALPIFDHFYEQKVIDVIEWSITELRKKEADMNYLKPIKR